MTKALVIPPVKSATVQNHAAKYEYKAKELQVLKDLLTNPVFEILLGYVAIEAMQVTQSPFTRTPAAMMPPLAGTIAEAGILTAVAMQQLAPLAPYMAQGAKGLSDLAPLLALIPK